MTVPSRHKRRRFSWPLPFSSATRSIRSSGRCSSNTQSAGSPSAGNLIGYWMPHEGTNNIAFALISFENLAAYENYRARLRADDEGMANFNFAEENRFIIAEERTFLRRVT